MPRSTATLVFLSAVLLFAGCAKYIERMGEDDATPDDDAGDDDSGDDDDDDIGDDDAGDDDAACQVSQMAGWVDVASGPHTSCGILHHGVWCWGYEVGSSEPHYGPFIDIAVGRKHGCAVRDDHAIECWGSSDHGTQTAPPTPPNDFVQVVAGYYHSCGLTSQGEVLCWGCVGTDGGEPVDKGQCSPPEAEFTFIAAGRSQNCGITVDGPILCWGDDELGQGSPTVASAEAVSCGPATTCAISSEFGNTCWGLESSTASDIPATGLLSLDVGLDLACGVGTSLEPVCWGCSQEDAWLCAAPEQQFEKIATGERHSCGLRTDGYIHCWGEDDEGQSGPGCDPSLGDDDTS